MPLICPALPQDIRFFNFKLDFRFLFHLKKSCLARAGGGKINQFAKFNFLALGIFDSLIIFETAEKSLAVFRAFFLLFLTFL
jgi:hypothetical protein